MCRFEINRIIKGSSVAIVIQKLLEICIGIIDINRRVILFNVRPLNK